LIAGLFGAQIPVDFIHELPQPGLVNILGLREYKGENLPALLVAPPPLNPNHFSNYSTPKLLIGN